ncbi:2-hydroxyacid dehydrogenase [Devosia sp. A449]
MKPDLVLTYPLMPAIEAELAQRFSVHRWHEQSDPARFLQQVGPVVRAVVTGGHLGLAKDMAAAMPSLEIVAINGVGYDKIDLEQARAQGFRVTNTPDLMADDVADLAIGLLVGFNRQLVRGDSYVRDGSWAAGEMPLGRKVAGARYGIFGMGRIGASIARRLEGFGGSIAYANRSQREVPYRYYPSLLELAAASDVLILAAAATPETRHIVGREVLDALGPDGLLINVARGALVNEVELASALRERRLRGAALDVFESEPNVATDLLAAGNLLVVPHIGAATAETRQQMGRLVLANLDAHFSGQPLPSPVL